MTDSRYEDTTQEPATQEPGWWERVKTFEPALLRAVVLAIVGVLAIWGVDLSEWGNRLIDSWMLLFPLLFLIQGWWTRTVVSPSGQVVAKQTPTGEVVAGPALVGVQNDLPVEVWPLGREEAA